MSGIYPTFETEAADAEPFAVVGKALSHNLDVLDELAVRLNVTPLSSLIDDRTMLGEIMDVDEESAPPVQWYAPQVGLETVKALRDHLSRYPEATEDTEATVKDLQGIAAELVAAEQRHTRFHLLVDL